MKFNYYLDRIWTHPQAKQYNQQWHNNLTAPCSRTQNPSRTGLCPSVLQNCSLPPLLMFSDKAKTAKGWNWVAVGGIPVSRSKPALAYSGPSPIPCWWPLLQEHRGRKVCVPPQRGRTELTARREFRSLCRISGLVATRTLQHHRACVMQVTTPSWCFRLLCTRLGPKWENLLNFEMFFMQPFRGRRVLSNAPNTLPSHDISVKVAGVQTRAGLNSCLSSMPVLDASIEKWFKIAWWGTFKMYIKNLNLYRLVSSLIL